MTHARAFTLIEMLTVLVLLAMLSAIVALSLSGRQKLADQEQLIRRIGLFEAQARVHARRAGATRSLIFDLSRNRISLFDDSARATVAENLELPQDYAMSRIYVSGSAVTAGAVPILVSPRGTTTSYAIFISGPNHFEARMLFVGQTGQQVKLDSEKQLRTIFALAKDARDDAH